MKNFPAYSTTGAAIYCYGKDGTPFYGFLKGDLKSDPKRYWELEAITSLGSSTWSTSNSPNGQPILDYANGFAFPEENTSERVAIMNAADRDAMKVRTDINTRDYRPQGEGFLLEAYMWAPSRTEYEANRTVGGLVYQNAGKVWTRSYNQLTEYGDGFSHYAWCVDNASCIFDILTSDYYVHSSQAVAPAFRLDLTKVLKVKKYPTNT